MRAIDSIINSPAATQQLLARVIDEDGTVQTNTFLTNVYRPMVRFDNTSFTQPYRFIATSNGSQCGVPLAAPYSQLAKFDAEGKAFLYGLFLWTGGRTYLDMHMLPNIGQTNQILDFSLKLKIKWVGFNLLKLAMKIQKNAPGYVLPLDGLAGGTRALGEYAPNLSNINGASGFSNWLIFGPSFSFSSPYIAPTFSFIATTSSLDVTNFTAYNLPYVIPQTGLNGSRAANYIAQEKITLASPVGVTNNVNHTDFYARTCKWLFDEMENNILVYKCKDYCLETLLRSEILGPRIICNTATYSLTNIPAGATISWSAGGSANPVFQLVPNATGSQVTITNLHYYASTTNLVATINLDSCSFVAAIKTISTDNDYQQPSTTGYQFTQSSCIAAGVNHPAENGTVSPSNMVFIHQGCPVQVNLGNLINDGKTVSFLSAGAPPDYWSVYNGVLYFQMPLGSGGVPATFKISGEGACFDRLLQFYVISGNGRNTYVANPNPVSNILSIEIKRDLIIAKSNVADYGIKISDFNSKVVVRQQQLKNISDKFQINMAGLKAGYYAVEITEGDEVKVLKILKLYTAFLF